MPSVLRLGLLWILAASTAQANVYTVAQGGGGDFTTIQAAIATAASGDEIRVEPGTYFENLDFLGKDLTVHSTSGPDQTILDGNHGPAEQGSCLILHSGETQSSVLEGFVLQRGRGSDRPPFGVSVGGAVLLHHASLTLRRCRLAENSAYNGGALFFFGGGATIVECEFNNNVATTYGGAISGSSGSLAITDCTFEGNVAQQGDGTVSLAEAASATIVRTDFLGNRARAGAGLNIGQMSAHTEVTDCTFAKNACMGIHGGGVRIDEGYAFFERCLFRENSAALDGGGLTLLDGAFTSVRNCTFYGNGAGRFGGQVAVYSSNLLREQVIFLGGTGPVGGLFVDSWSPSLGCCDAWNNQGGSYHGMPDPTGSDGNISLDPALCDPEGDDFHLASSSPCAPHSPPNAECDLIGAFPVGCQAASAPGSDEARTTQRSWGRIKRDFHR